MNDHTFGNYAALYEIHALKEKLGNVKELLEQLETKRMQARHETWFAQKDINKFIEQLKSILHSWRG